MTVEQYTAFLDLIPDIERVLKSKGKEVPRLRFDKATADEDDEENGEDEVVKEEEDEPLSRKGKLDKLKMKKNHEMTSEEEEG